MWNILVLYKINAVIGFDSCITYLYITIHYPCFYSKDLFVFNWSVYTLFGIFMLRHRCGWHDSGRYVVSPGILLIDVCMYGALTLVILLWSGYHRKFSVLLPLLFLFHIFLWGIRLIVGFYCTLCWLLMLCIHLLLMWKGILGIILVNN